MKMGRDLVGSERLGYQVGKGSGEKNYMELFS